MSLLSLTGEDNAMQFPNVRMHMVLILALLLFSWSALAQDKIEREVMIHKNVKLVILAPAQEIPEDITSQFKSFQPIFEEVLKQNTADQADECSLTLRLSIGIKEIGAGKSKRPQASVSAFRRNSKQEYLGKLILYSYATSGLVNKEETEQFLKKQILDPAECK